MATTIDELQIEINAKATKANDAIDRLVSKLDTLSVSLSRVSNTNLSGLANGVDRLGKAMQVMNTIKTADFTRLAKNIEKMGTINTQAINNTASSLSNITRAFSNLGTVSSNAQQIAVLASNLSRLGSANMQKAITNIPLLADAMSNLLVRLSQAPIVSANVIQLTNALANLSSQGARVGTASKSVQRGLNQISTSSQRAQRHTTSLAYSFGKFYANFFLAIRGLKGLWSSIESTADYIEAYNYFNVALGKIGSDWSHQWEKYGYDNAEAYAESFSTRLNSKLQGMSGLQVSIGADGQGLLTTTNIKNLGVNIQELTQYASQLASVTNSIGQTGEVSLAAASAFSKLGADMSSLFNIDYSSAMKNLQSGLIGQSRALYRYGYDITNATLQTYAYELGLSKAVSEMTQAEKMQLRMIAILDQSKVAWGDLANTISSPSNQIRILKNNLKETGMVLGQLFVPLLERVLPLFNALTLVVKDLLISFANFAGIKINFEAFGEGFIADEDILDMEESLDGAVTSLEELKNQIMGFDEVNPLDSISDSFDSIADGIDLTTEILTKTEEYEKVWNEAYGRMQETASEFANTIKGKFSGLGESITNLGNALKNLDGLEFLGEGFAEGFMNVIDFLVNDVGATAINNLANTLEVLGIGFNELDDEQIKDIGEAIGEITAAILVYKAGSVALTAGLNLLGLLMQYKSLGTFTVGVTFAIGGFEFGKGIGETLDPENLDYYKNFKWFGEGGFFDTVGSTDFLTVIASVGAAIEDVQEKVRKFLNLEKIAAPFKTFEQNVFGVIAAIRLTGEELEDFADKLLRIDLNTKFSFGAGIAESFKAGVESAKKLWSDFAKWLNEKLVLKIDTSTLIGKGIMASLGGASSIALGKIATFQTGGFPEDGLFMANRGELVGQFSNGKTAVANNAQIVAGIEGGVERAVVRVLAPYLADIAESSRITANKNFGISQRSVFEATRREANNYTMQTGRSPFLA